MIEVTEYLDPDGTSPFGEWYGDLESQAAAKVLVALTRMGLGNFGDTKSVGKGVQGDASRLGSATVFTLEEMATRSSSF